MNGNKKEMVSIKAGFMLAALFLFVLVSCAHKPLTTRASLVRLVTAEQAHGIEKECEFVGNVLGTSFSILRQDMAYHNALNELLDNAAELGASHLFVNLGGLRDLRGEAYFCAFCLITEGVSDEDRCLDTTGNKVVINKMPIKDKDTCEAEGSRWITKARDKITCERRGGTWIPDTDVLRKMYLKEKAK